MKSKGWIITTVVIVSAIIVTCIIDFLQEKGLYEDVMNINTIEACDEYLALQQGRYINEVEQLKRNLIKRQEKEKEDLVWQEANTTKSYENYLNKYPQGNYSEKAKEFITQQKEKEETKKWSTDALAWHEATNRNTSAAYKKYLQLYPYGINAQQAKKLIIDKEVDEIFGGDHGTLPSMDKTSYGNGTDSRISVYNNTSYTLTLRYSGTESYSVDIPSQAKHTISLRNGRYRIAASVSASNVRNYAGTENLTGGSYNVEYYISTHTYRY